MLSSKCQAYIIVIFYVRYGMELQIISIDVLVCIINGFNQGQQFEGMIMFVSFSLT